MRKVLSLRLLLAVAFLVLEAQTFAQVPEPPTPTEVFDLTFVVGSVGAAVIYAATFGVKKVLPRLPKLVVLAIPLVLGGVATYALGVQAHQVPGSLQYLGLGTLASLIDNVLKYARA
jgi:hypothetical protein